VRIRIRTSSIDRFRLEVASEDEEKQHLLQEQEILKNKVLQLNQNQAQLSLEHDEQKKYKQELEAEISKLDTAIEEKEREVIQVKSQIVQSPEKHKHSVVDLGNALEKERTLITEEEKKLIALESRLKSIKKIKADLEKCVSSLNSVESVKSQISEQKSVISNQEQELSSLTNKKRDLMLREKQMLGQLRVLEEGNKRNLEYYNPRLHESSQKLISAQHQRALQQQEQTTLSTSVKELEARTKDLEHKKENLQKVYLNQINKMEQMEDELLQLLQAYKDRLTGLFNS